MGVKLAAITRFLMTYRLALRLLVLVNVLHMAIHGTVLDQGALDNVIENLDNWLISQINL